MDPGFVFATSLTSFVQSLFYNIFYKKGAIM